MNWKNILEDERFENIAQVPRLGLEAWWSPAKELEVRVFAVGSVVWLNGCKTYFVKGITEDQEDLYARDLGALAEWLRTHFTSMQLHLHHCRDVSRSLILSRVRQKRFREAGTDSGIAPAEERLSQVQAEFEERKNRLQETQALLRLTAISSVKSDTITGMLSEEEARLRQEMTALAGEGKRLEVNSSFARALLQEYQNKSSAVSLAFSFTTDGHWVSNEREFREALHAIVKEISDWDKYQVRQKLEQGRLRIPVEASNNPCLDWLGLWTGGFPNLREMERWNASLEQIRQEIEARFFVAPVSDIVVGGACKDQKKLVGERVIQSFLQCLPRVQTRLSPSLDIRTDGKWLGLVMLGNETSNAAFNHPANLQNGYISGTTRCGKTHLGRCLAENAIMEGAVVNVLDPTRQWCGLAFPARNEGLLQKLDEFGISRHRATGFPVRIFIPGTSLDLPARIADILATSSVISLKGCTDLERCTIARDFLKAAYEQESVETPRLKRLVVLEEAHTFLPGNVSKEAEPVAKEVATLIGRVAREKVKYGICQLFVTQSLADFRTSARVVREMCNSRFFMRATDPAELEFVEHYVSKEAAQIVKNLRPGEALVHGALGPTAKVLIRPPLSETHEIPDNGIFAAMSVSPNLPTSEPELSPAEKAVLELVRAHYRHTSTPLPAAALGARLGLEGGARQRVTDGLKAKALVKTVTLKSNAPGRPAQGLIPAGACAPEEGE